MVTSGFEMSHRPHPLTRTPILGRLHSGHGLIIEHRSESQRKGGNNYGPYHGRAIPRKEGRLRPSSMNHALSLIFTIRLLWKLTQLCQAMSQAGKLL